MAYGEMTAADRKRLDEGDQAKTVRSWNGNNNPSATDWMLTVSAEQNGREITEADLVDAFEDWSWMGQREEGGHTGYRHYQLFMQATSRSGSRRFGRVLRRSTASM